MLTVTPPITTRPTRHTHCFIVDQDIRAAYAAELLAHYREARRSKVDLRGEWWAGMIWGFESMAWSLQRRRNANKELG